MKTKFYLIALFVLYFSSFSAQTLMNETFTGASLPTGWSITSTATTTEQQWAFYDVYDDIEVNESGTVAQNEWLFLPALNLQSYSKMFFNFSLWMWNKSSYVTNKTCRTEVMISTDNGVTWSQVWDSYTLNLIEFGGNALYDRFWSINLTSYCGSGKPPVKLAFKYTSTGTSASISFAALIRVNIASTGITSFSKLYKNVLNWYPVRDYSGNYDIYYGPLGTTTEKGGGILVSGISGSSYTIPENYCQYTAFIRTNNGAPGEWVQLTFGNGVDNIIAAPTSNSSLITWTGDTDLYDLEYGVGNFTVGAGTRVTNISSTNYLINSLSANTLYKVYIKASCRESGWRSITFTTPLLATSEANVPKLNIFPNPTSDFLNFSEMVDGLQILDRSARLIKIEKKSVRRVDISQISKGVYTISGTVKGEKFRRTIIKR